MAPPISSTTARSAITPPSRPLVEDLGWDPDVLTELLETRTEVYGANEASDALNDLYGKAQDVAAAQAVTEAAQTGVTAVGGPVAQGAGFPPGQCVERLDPVAAQLGNAPSPQAYPCSPPTPELSTLACGTAAPGLRVSAAHASAEGALYQSAKLEPVDHTVLGTPQVPADGPYNLIANKPSELAKRERTESEAKGVTLPNGMGWDEWEKKRTDELQAKWQEIGGVFSVNPELIAKQACDKARAAGLDVPEGFQKQLETIVSNHYVQLNGGLVCTGGQLREFTEKLAVQMQPVEGAALAQTASEPTMARVVGGLGGTAIGAMVGTSIMPGVGTLLGAGIGWLGGDQIGRLWNSVVGGDAKVNPAITQMPALAANPLAMGMGAGLATTGVNMGAGMSKIGQTAASLTGNVMLAQEMAQATTTEWQYQMMDQETRLKRLMAKASMAAGDSDMANMLMSSNMPIEKLVAMWSLKTASRSEQEIKDKMLAAENAKQREKTEQNRNDRQAEERAAVVNSTQLAAAAAGGVGTAATLGASVLGGPVGGMVAGGLTSAAGMAINAAGNATVTAMSQAHRFENAAKNAMYGGAPGESAASLQLQVQMAVEEWKRTNDLASNIMKSLHEMAMTAINNTRG